MTTDRAYLLGHSAQEWTRLEEQHALWGPVLLADLERLGLRPGMRVLEVGCGNGALLADLAAAAAPGAVVGLEQDPAAAASAQERVGARAEVRVADVLGDDAAATLAGPWDFVVARWVLSFLPTTAALIRRLASGLVPGGALVVHDYNHHGMGLWPRRPLVDHVIEAYRTAYAARGGDLFVATKLPGLFAAAGLADVAIWPHMMAGPPASPPWRWVERFVLEHRHTLVAGGFVTPAQADAFAQAWAEAAGDPGSVLFGPPVVTVVGRG